MKIENGNLTIEPIADIDYNGSEYDCSIHVIVEDQNVVIYATENNQKEDVDEYKRKIRKFTI